MVQFGYISPSYVKAVSSYYDPSYEADVASLIYCIDWSVVDSSNSNLASCFVRIGK